MWFRWSRASSLQSCGTDELSHALTCPLCRRLLLQQQQQPRCPGTVPGTRWTARHLTADSHALTPDTVTGRTVRLSPVSKYDTIYSWLRDHSRSRFPGLARENYTAAQEKYVKKNKRNAHHRCCQVSREKPSNQVTVSICRAREGKQANRSCKNQP